MSSAALSEFTRFRLKLSDSVYHDCFLKEDAEAENSIFLINVPSDATEKCIKNIMSELGGRVVTVNPPLSKNRSCNLKLHIQLLEENEVKRVLKQASKKSLVIQWPMTQSSGLERFTRQYDRQFPRHEVLQESVDAYMNRVAKMEAERKKQLLLARNQPDEDGFITVVRGGRNRVGNEEEAKAILARKKEVGIHHNFYRWQVREEKKKKLNDLVRKFEQDKQRIQQIRESRRFKPY
ncbi:rRNA processing protein Rrp7 [Schizosaccharomyces japonicus yFS275]|uniref:rRNA processing protein Rrp7 n=1 Tax=Schizosaccharomyces japonicus (strain yFS275 / FY16936) TaxID=402676 RepID=B6K4Q5_SCHJY|nr:rRNA processing protein Rrp7 [Schizosaccharomyces japonicus yFS275]EEB08462.1 rRNA processing protein Rrp7 [Schizosaccharomyces japonicus yFS275]